MTEEKKKPLTKEQLAERKEARRAYEQWLAQSLYDEHMDRVREGWLYERNGGRHEMDE